MEGLALVVAVAILGSHDVGVSVLLGCPGGLVEELSVGLEAGGDGAAAVGLLEGVVELELAHWQLGVSVGLGPGVWLQIGLPEGGAPLLMQGWVRWEHGSLSVAAEEAWSSLIEVALVSRKSIKNGEQNKLTLGSGISGA